MIKQLILLMLGLLGGSFTAAAQNIVAAEYFFDTDPGVNNATRLTISNPADSINLLDSINLAGLARGQHQFCIRYQNALGHWSHSQCYPVVVSQPQTTPLIVAGEWFVNADPGIGNAIPFPVNNPRDPLSGLDSIYLDTLSRGIHRFCVRYYNNMGQWSHSECYTIQVSQPQLPTLITAGEYFFDTDPGIGNAIPLTNFTPADSINLLDSLPIGNLSTGVHVFGLRYHNNKNQWSHTARYLIQVTKEKKLVALEYVVDGTPGIQAGTVVNINPPASQVQHQDSVNTTPLAVGWHTLTVRAQDQNGQWSENELDSFYVCNAVVATANVLVTDSTICAGESVGFTATINNAGPNPSYSWLLNGSPVSTGQTTYNTDSLQAGDIVSFYLESNAYCVLDSTVVSPPVSITVNPNPTVTATASSTAVCAGEMLTLTATGADNYVWDNGVINGQPFFPLFSQAYEVIGTNADGCADTVSTAVIQVNPLPIVSFTPLAIAYCDTVNAIPLTGSPAGGTFSGAGVSNGVFSPNAAQAGVHPITYVYVDNNGCTDSLTQIANILDCTNLATPNLSNLQSIKAYPNPTSNWLNVELELLAGSQLSMRLVNTWGQVLYESELSQSGLYQIDLQQLPAGTYFLHTIDAQGQQSQQAIVKME